MMFAVVINENTLAFGGALESWTGRIHEVISVWLPLRCLSIYTRFW